MKHLAACLLVVLCFAGATVPHGAAAPTEFPTANRAADAAVAQVAGDDETAAQAATTGKTIVREAAARETTAQGSKPDESAAPSAASDDPSESDARRALGRWWRFPWYNSSTDDLEPVLVRPSRPASMPDFSPLQYLAWILTAIVLATLVWLIVNAILNYAGFKKQEVATPRVATRVDQVEALPFLKQRSLDDLLGQARQHFLAGDFNEAIIYLFSYQLVELDRHNLIRLGVGRTNRQYLRDLQGRGPLVELVEGTMIAFEDVYFGGRRLSQEQFQRVWDRVGEFEGLVAQFSAEALPTASAADTAPVEMTIAAG